MPRPPNNRCEDIENLTDREIKEWIKHLKGVLAERQRQRGVIRYLANTARLHGWTLRSLADMEIPAASKAKNVKDAIRIAVEDEGFNAAQLAKILSLKKGPST